MVHHHKAVKVAALGILAQKRALLKTIKPQHFVHPCPLVEGSTIGQHLRHSLDHYAKCLAVVADPQVAVEREIKAAIEYDVRERGTSIETDLRHATTLVDKVASQIEALQPLVLDLPVTASFIISAEGHHHKFKSTVARELGFATHHAIHHAAIIKIIATSLGYHLPEGFGLAPSTANYNLSLGQAQRPPAHKKGVAA